MIFSDLVGIIADDLTGANDTALQFQQLGANTKILLDSETLPQNRNGVEVWAISTESRNISAGDAIIQVGKAARTFYDNFNFDYYYKKIDSTLRGNIAVETLTMLDVLEYDAAIIVPAFPQEERITVGGYHLAKGVPIGQTEMAMDPSSPITESHVPTLLRSQLKTSRDDVVGVIDLRTVMNGAGPILQKINELVSEGKRLIIADAVSIVDIEQIALAVTKCEKKILPTGTASGAMVFGKYWLAGIEKRDYNLKIENYPKLIVSGTATNITANQIKRLEVSKYDNINFIPLSKEDILQGVSEDLLDKILINLKNNINVCIYTSHIIANFDGFADDSLDAELTKKKFISKITDYLAELTERIVSKIDVILITLGGETSYKCCKKIDSNELKLMDEVAPAIAISQDIHNRWIITKSGNLGGSTTVIDILDYLRHHE